MFKEVDFVVDEEIFKVVEEEVTLNENPAGVVIFCLKLELLKV